MGDHRGGQETVGDSGGLSVNAGYGKTGISGYRWFRVEDNDTAIHFQI